MTLDALPILSGETADSLASRGGVRGFCYTSPTDDVRYQTSYATAHEKSWCECSDLCDHGLWEEARLKLDELERNRSTPELDMQMEARVYFGYAMHRAGQADTRIGEIEYQAAAQALRACAQVCESRGDDANEMDALISLSDVTRPYCDAILFDAPPSPPFSHGAGMDLTSVPLDKLHTAAQALFFLLETYGEHALVCTDDLEDCFHVCTKVAKELGARGWLEEARQMSSDLIGAHFQLGKHAPSGCVGDWHGLIAEISEALGGTERAHAAYSAMLTCGLDEYETNATNDPSSAPAGLLSGERAPPPGTLAERLARTAPTPADDAS